MRHGKRLLLVSAVVSLVLVGIAAASETDCRESPAVIDRCFTVHGRLGHGVNLALRIWPVGSNRLLAVIDPRDRAPLAPMSLDPNDPRPPLPRNLINVIGVDIDVFGDYEVCPLTPEKPDVMQLVCIDSASRLVARPRGQR
ncbi:MAG: hypothetical protein HY246_19970 [Proteobacteria bacterium]|nr:hypothetical protein [Pseudomonadota bacterium]